MLEKILSPFVFFVLTEYINKVQYFSLILWYWGRGDNLDYNDLESAFQVVVEHLSFCVTLYRYNFVKFFLQHITNSFSIAPCV